jgi:hypothetical protein
MSSIMDEISDDLRQQQLKEFWRENGNWIIGGAILAVVMTGATVFWRGYQADQNRAETGALLSVARLADTEKLAEFAKDTDRDHAMMARFAAAALEARQGNADKAAALYNEIAGTKFIDGSWRDLAKLLAVGQRLEKDDPSKLHADLNDLTGKKSTWRFSALEMQALVYAREKKYAQAVESLTAIVANAKAPADVRTRAATLRQLYLGAAEKEGK